MAKAAFWILTLRRSRRCPLSLHANRPAQERNPLQRTCDAALAAQEEISLSDVSYVRDLEIGTERSQLSQVSFGPRGCN